ncbi:TM2 domain-containing protein [Phaeodactylibacter luteus]|uniref:TM2 domain-containing protein n=1 Tax=Phaeodactylibacter luteus TaxID=1564516 RepID=A0A5C6RPC7_9BACT|nr:TM2 domain-containing protein [Phaeodactylibacter luteus]
MALKAAQKKIKKELRKVDESAPKSQLIALLLVILVGGIGIHRFYLGYTTIGIIQLLTLGGCGVWALIDLIRIITGDLGPADGSAYDPKL